MDANTIFVQDDRCIIPEEIKRMTSEERQREIKRLEAEAREKRNHTNEIK